MKFETKGDPKKKVKTLVDAKQSSKSCHKGDAVKDKDKDLDVQVAYKETKTESRTYTQTDGFTFSGNLKGKNIYSMSVPLFLVFALFLWRSHNFHSFYLREERVYAMSKSLLQ